MNIEGTPHLVSHRRQSICKKTSMIVSAMLSLEAAASGAQIGMHFVRTNVDVAGVQNGFANSLAVTDEAGAPGLAQTNWNNLGFRGTNIVLLDRSGAASGVAVSW